MKSAASFVSFLCACTLTATLSAAEAYRSPFSLAVAPDDTTVYAIDRTAGCVAVLDRAAGKLSCEIVIGGEPWGAALSADGKLLYVSQRAAGTVAVVDTAKKAVVQTWPVGPWPTGVALAEKRGRLYVCCRGDHTLAEVELSSGRVLRRTAMTRDPFAVAVTPDEVRLVVTNYLPQGAATDPALASTLTVLNADKFTATWRTKLPPGTTALGGVCTSPDGRWAYAVHAVGRFMLPITQLERGWVHTYGFSIIEIASGKRLATLLLDDMSGGAADPWDVTVSRDGKTLFVSHAGVHQVSVVDIGRIHELLDGKIGPELAALKDGTRDNVWARISKDRKVIDELTNDLTALHMAGAIRRIPTGGLGPRGLALSPDGQRLYAANCYSGTIGAIDVSTGKLAATIPAGTSPPPDAARRGEIYFHDANRCFQHWHSCFSCHLDDGRTDGLTWDFMRDGIGNGKDVISLVGMMETSPHNRRATRPSPRECMRTGVIGSHLVVPSEAEVDDLLAYVGSLKPERNPAAGSLKAAAERGRALYEGKASCAGCHPAPLYTDKRQHDVGVHSPLEPDGRYDTPSLVECYRTGPYLHDGRAATLKDVFSTHNADERHGHTRNLTPEELDDLVAFLRSL